MVRGKFITIEGIDGSGKTTQCKSLLKWLLEHHDAILTREPGGSFAAERLRDVFLEHDWDGFSEACLLAAGRRHHVDHLIEPELTHGRWVVSDRFAVTTVAYQTWGRSVPGYLVAVLNQQAIGLTWPDLTVVVDLDPRIAHDRMLASGKPLDRMESLGVSFFDRVREGFLHVARNGGDRYVVVDGSQDPYSVQEEIKHVVEKRLM